jgi:LysR family glycine cleavage system transcriptional activator
MKSSRLPPLAAMRAFECLCRSGTYAAAALELNVTEAAIQHQLRNLERTIGRRLVEREQSTSRGKAVTLTEAGRDAAAWIGAGFDCLRKGIEKQHGRESLVLGVPVSFAVCWLSPRLQALQTRFPNFDIELRTYHGGDPNGRVSGCDMHVVYGEGQALDEDIALLTRLEAFPVSSPSLVGGEKHLSYADLRGLPLLRDATPDMERSLPDWQLWFNRMGRDPSAYRYGTVSSNTFLNIEAARRGQGVAMAFGRLVQQDLTSGALVRLLETEYPIHHSYWVAVPNFAPDAAKDVAHWLISEMKELAA